MGGKKRKNKTNKYPEPPQDVRFAECGLCSTRSIECSDKIKRNTLCEKMQTNETTHLDGIHNTSCYFFVICQYIRQCGSETSQGGRGDFNYVAPY